MSATISRIERTCAAVSWNGSASRSCVVRARRLTNWMPARCVRASSFARCCSNCTKNNSSNARRERPAIASASDAGRCTKRSAAAMPGTPRRGEDVGRQILDDLAKQRVEVRVDDDADLLERQPFGGRVDGEHASLRGRRLVVAEIDELARLELAAVKEPHGARDEQHVALVDGAVEKGLPGP